MEQLHMRTSHKLAMMAVASLATAPFVGMGTALADDGDVNANLQPVALNGVSASGTAWVQVRGTKISVKMQASGLLADSPHAAHIHFAADARHECPIASDDSDGSGTLNTTEGGPAYGTVVVALTTSGDTSPDSTLAVDRFDTAPGGNLTYQRGSITVAPDVANAISAGQAVVVVHGVDHNNDGKYDGSTMSDLDPKLPTEATDPAICGVLLASPTGGPATGMGGASSGTDAGLLALGGGLMLAAAGTGVVTARRARARS
jgi:hypothetical protein